MSTLLQTLGQGQGFLKAGFLGFQKSGKTYTAVLLAILVRRLFGLTGPIGMFDTEGGSEYVAPVVKLATGQDLVGLRSRSFDELVESSREAEKSGVSVWISDSMTHVWRDLCRAYLVEVNESRRRLNLVPRNKLVMNDWNLLKEKWEEEFTTLYLNSKLHYIVCGRAGYIFDFEDDEETGGKDLIKTGIKMKTEGEFGYEPSLVVLMEQIQNLRPQMEVGQAEQSKRKKKFRRSRAGVAISRQATVIGDRFSVIDGAQTIFRTLDGKSKDKLQKELAAVEAFFRPHLDLLKPGTHAPINTALTTTFGFDQSGDGTFRREQVQREIYCEEIQGELVAAYPGQTAADKKAKADLIFQVFDTRSWKKVETLNVTDLKEGLKAIRKQISERLSSVESSLAKLEERIPVNGGAHDGESLPSASDVS
jgi:hypothetical protein